MLISSNDLLGTAAIAARSAATTMEACREHPLSINDDMAYAEARLVQALAELRAARWGVQRRMPQFDGGDLDIVLEHEAVALRGAHGFIPAAQ